ncbi:hypothetical protein LR48_Vigan53s001700 [Vigna angularis]|uniref:Uncharacterized protein n=1 Tax=Phaseolus angularis TaxID=3914 RepID=A0A0L9T3P9_PHAAN|nr:hypothetical protein LR48_Vigan53s001700 [Vigna angularis]
MASSSGKRLKTMTTKRKEKEPEQPHSSRFLSRKHEKHFKVVQDRRLLMERKVGMIPNFAPQFGEQLLGNDWGKLATYPAPANIAVLGWTLLLHHLKGQEKPLMRPITDSTVEVRRQLSQFHHAMLAERGQAHNQTSTETHEAEPFQMRDMYMSLIEQVQGGGAEAAEALVRKMEEDEADDDAFEDDEDEEEEEDTEDNSD